jgi:hypothetical protein
LSTWVSADVGCACTGSVYNSSKGECVACGVTPLARTTTSVDSQNSSKCQCIANATWKDIESGCVCNSGTVWDSAAGLCRVCGVDSLLLLTTNVPTGFDNRCTCDYNSSWSSVSTGCSCIEDFVYDSNSKKCRHCGISFSEENSNLNYSLSLGRNSSDKTICDCKENTNDFSISNGCTCITNAELFDDTCWYCPAGKYYNTIIKDCATCSTIANNDFLDSKNDSLTINYCGCLGSITFDRDNVKCNCTIGTQFAYCRIKYR